MNNRRIRMRSVPLSLTCSQPRLMGLMRSSHRLIRSFPRKNNFFLFPFFPINFRLCQAVIDHFFAHPKKWSKERMPHAALVAGSSTPLAVGSALFFSGSLPKFPPVSFGFPRSEEHTSELQSHVNL